MPLELFQGRQLRLPGASPGWASIWLAAGALTLTLLVVLYRDERRLVSRKVGLGLLGLRLAAATVLVLTLFEPIATRSYRETVKGRVIVAVDISASMDTADPGRSNAERQRLAQTLKLPPGEPVESLARREVAHHLVERADSPLRTLETSHTVEWVAFARRATPTSRASLSTTLKQPPPPDDSTTLTTDWQPVLTDALRERDAPLVGVVLLTDGRQNALTSERESAATLDRLAARGIPVYPVLIGTAVPPRDAAIAAVRAPRGVYRGDVAHIEATLKLDGYTGRDVTVTLERPGASPLEQRVRVPTSPPGARPVVSFAVPLTEAGSVPLTIALRPLEGDVRPDNDRRTVPIQVSDDQAAVLLVDGEARWEFRYVRNALARDPQVKLETVVFHQPETTGVSTRPSYGTTLPARPDPGSDARSRPTPNSTLEVADPLGSFDVIVLGDVAPADVSAATWARLESFVAERGGTLILSPGPRFWSSLAEQEIPRKLWPVRAPRPVPPEPTATSAADSLPPGAIILPTLAANSDAAAWPMLQFASGSDSGPEQNRRLWTGLPRLPWALAGSPKPGATVLAAVPSSTGDESAAVIAAQPYGLGKVLWVGTDGTWRWRYRVGDAYHHRFWGQAIRWGVSGKLATGNAFVRFGPTRPQVAEGDEVRLQARIADGVRIPGQAGDNLDPALLIAARLFRAEAAATGTIDPDTASAVALVPLHPVAGQPRLYEGSVPALPLGRYRIRLDAPQLTEALHLDDPKSAPQASVEVVPRETSERVELTVDRESAARLAASTGGRVFADYEAGALPSQLGAQTTRTLRTDETPLWDHPATLLLFFGIVTSEWLLRKRAGLP